MTQDPWGALSGIHPSIPRQGLERYVEELGRWNRTIRLIGPRDTPGIRLQVVDAVLPFLHIAPRFPLLDIGSGAGLPGIPLALLYPGETVVCLEPRLKRVSFLRHAARTLGLEGLRVVPERTDGALRADPALAGYAATATARAVAEVGALLHAAGPFLAPGGSVLLPRGGEQVEQIPPGWKRTRCVSYPAPKPLGFRTVQEFRRG